MSKAEILQELPKLSPEDRAEIHLKLVELDENDWDDADDPVSTKEKALVKKRIADQERQPGSAISTVELFRRVEKRRQT